MFIIDFDDTLFNTRPGFRTARYDALVPLGVSKELYDKTYLLARSDRTGKCWYNDRRHAQMLAEEGFDEDKIFVALEATVASEQLKKFLFPDSISFLENLKKFGEPMVLLSLGDAEYQFVKVRGLEIEHYFDRVFMVDEKKTVIMKEILDSVSDKQIWFINDKIDEIKEIIEQFKMVRPILKEAHERFPAAQYVMSGLPHFETLTEIYEYIVKNR